MSKRGRKTNQVWWCKVLSINRPGKPVKSEARRVRIDRYRLPQVCCSAGLQHSFLQNGVQGDLHIFMRHDASLCARRGAKSMFVGLRWTPRGTCKARQQVYFRRASMDSYTLVHARHGIKSVSVGGPWTPAHWGQSPLGMCRARRQVYFLGASMDFCILGPNSSGHVQSTAASLFPGGFDGLLHISTCRARHQVYFHGGSMDSCTLGPKSSRHVQGTAPSLFPWGLDGFLHIGAKFIGARAEHGSKSISGGLRWTPTHWCTPMSVRASINVFP